MNAKQIAERLREQAAEIAAAGHAGWGNTMTAAADLLDRMAWVPVSERLPEEAQQVLFVRSGKTHFGAWADGNFWYSNQRVAALYWMPLPNPPK